ncbi:MAG: ABC transporter permease [Thermoplasmata archaeon]|nr:ABC transporter permease [Thermoplasmata archaeon]
MFLLTHPRRNPFRWSLVIFAIASSIILTTMMISLSAGIRESSDRTLDRIGADVYVVPKDLNPLLINLQRFDQGGSILDAIRSSPHPPIHFSPRSYDTLFINSTDLNKISEISVYGIVPEMEQNFGQFEVTSGQWFDTDNDPVREEYRSTGIVREDLFTLEVIISSQLSKNLGVDIGDTILLSSRIQGGDEFSYRIEGIYSDMLAGHGEGILIHLGELQMIKGTHIQDTLTEILLKMDGQDNIEELIQWSKGDQFIFGGVVDLHTRGDILGELYGFTSLIDGFSAIVITISILVSLTFLTVILMISIKGMGKELAMLRAIGFSRWSLMFHLFQESFLNTFIGGIIGLIFGVMVVKIMNYLLSETIDQLPTGFELFSIDIVTLLMVIIIFTVISTGAGMIPALISSLKDPSEAMRGESK